jgi:hypothetical protein
MDEEVIPILHVADAATAVAWYERLGFSKEWEPAADQQAGSLTAWSLTRVPLFVTAR